MDATPVTLGQEFGGYATQVDDGIARLHDTLPRLCVLPLGGTAVGTGHQRAEGLRPQGDRRGSRSAPGCRSPRRRTTSPRKARATRWSRRAGSCARSRSSLVKIANDLRWMGSGPRTGLGRDPASRPPAGFVDHAGQGEPGDPGSRHAGRRAGDGQRRDDRRSRARRATSSSTCSCRVIARDLLESIDAAWRRACTRVRRASASRASRPTSRRCKEYAESSPSIGTALNPYIGYETDGRDREGVGAHRQVDSRHRARAQAHDRRRARSRARCRGDDPGRHRRMTANVRRAGADRVDHGFEARDHRRVPREPRHRAAASSSRSRSPARLRCSPRRFTRSPTPATRVCCMLGGKRSLPARRRRAPVRLRDAALLLGVRRRARVVQRRRRVRDLRGHREARASARGRRPAVRNRRAHRARDPRRRSRSAPARAEAERRCGRRASRGGSSCGTRRSPSCRSCCSRTSARSSGSRSRSSA